MNKWVPGWQPLRMAALGLMAFGAATAALAQARIESISSIGVVLNISLVDVFVSLIPVITLQQVFYNVISSLFVAVKLFVATCK